jgi:hypothetical protein
MRTKLLWVSTHKRQHAVTLLLAARLRIARLVVCMKIAVT